MSTTDPEHKAKVTALMSWEAGCERLRKTILPPAGYPQPTPDEIQQAFSNAASRLHELRALYEEPYRP